MQFNATQVQSLSPSLKCKPSLRPPPLPKGWPISLAWQPVLEEGGGTDGWHLVTCQLLPIMQTWSPSRLPNWLPSWIKVRCFDRTVNEPRPISPNSSQTYTKSTNEYFVGQICLHGFDPVRNDGASSYNPFVIIRYCSKKRKHCMPEGPLTAW